ncbi:hypothetical protein HB779_17310 [Phyllobacterium sp. 628]|uniref:hypothetical protein n=1 Tax=Phyllobacterium sp. 628 TaxID=2718938 RepID=UPI0016622653|nr:hypothetical protein [Phyllobacterium sp. 628]QND53449.1 hypothetical protein HB779_17310 [Phyllobacterium sp. 628]
MANQTGIAITIRAFLQTGKTLDEQFNALSIVKAAHETGDYSALLKAATVDEVKTEQRTRRVEDTPPVTTTTDDQTTTTVTNETTSETNTVATDLDDADQSEAPDDASVPEFIKNDAKKNKAA